MEIFEFVQKRFDSKKSDVEQEVIKLEKEIANESNKKEECESDSWISQKQIAEKCVCSEEEILG